MLVGDGSEARIRADKGAGAEIGKKHKRQQYLPISKHAKKKQTDKIR